MRVLRLLLPVIALCCLGMADRPPTVTVRFFAEANSRDGTSFSTPIKLGNPPRDAFLEKIAVVHERQIRAIYPFKTPDGTWGCTFKLDNDGRLGLEVVSTERRGTFLVGFLGTKKGSHRVCDIMIDRTVTDGIITMPKGLTDMEIAVLSKQFKVLGNAGDVPKLKTEKRSWNPFRKKEAAPALTSVAE
ncbi:MAG: hypothetical protein WCF18_14255 [Chthoniobacteraceae bacterium]